MTLVDVVDAYEYVVKTEEELEKIGEEAGMADSRCHVKMDETNLTCEDQDGGVHLFTFATPQSLEW